jgi:hypothetical protein
MAGTDTRFDAAQFREAIQFAMSMGSPAETADQVTFRWNTKDDYASDEEDNTGRPWDWTSTPTADNSVDDVILTNVAVEYRSGLGDLTSKAIGQFDNPAAVVTVLDEDYASIVGADEVLLGQNTYVIDYVTQVGLFEVDVYQIHTTARDES